MSDVEAYTGEIRLFAGTTVPDGWALCEGQLLDRYEYQSLFDLIHNVYGGDGVTTFCLPDLRGRAPLSQGTGARLSARLVGQQGGTEQVALAVRQLPGHRHLLRGSKLAADSTRPVTGSVLAQAPSPSRAYVVRAPDPNECLAVGTVQASGGAAEHENRMPSLALHFMICLYGRHP